jgi:hypothetical protein
MAGVLAKRKKLQAGLAGTMGTTSAGAAPGASAPLWGPALLARKAANRSFFGY